MSAVRDLLDKQAHALRALAADATAAATSAEAGVESTRGVLATARNAREAAEAQLAELQRWLVIARREEEEALAEHEAALAVVARDRADAEQAADIAEALDRLAGEIGARLVPVPAAEAIASTGLMPPVADELTAPGVVDSRAEVARLTGGHPVVVAPPTPDEQVQGLAAALADGNPLTTLKDPLPPADGGPRHQAPRAHERRDWSGPFRQIADRLRHDEQQEATDG